MTHVKTLWPDECAISLLEGAKGDSGCLETDSEEDSDIEVRPLIQDKYQVKSEVAGMMQHEAMGINRSNFDMGSRSVSFDLLFI